MDIYLYFGLVIILILMSIANYYIDTLNISTISMSLIVVSFVIFTVHIYYVSVNAIDSINYQTLFDYVNILTIKVDFFFISYIKLLKIFTNDYKVFRAIIGLIYLAPIILIIRKEKNINKNIFLLLCLLYPYFQNIVALRFTMASTISILSIYLYLNKGKSLKDIILTIVVIGIASMIHDTNFLYLLLFIIYLVFMKLENKKIMLVFFYLICILLILGLRLGLLNKIVNVIIGETNLFYLETMNTASMGFLIFIFLQISFIVLLYRTVKNSRKLKTVNKYDEKILVLNYCSIIFIPMYSINVLSFRLFRGLLLLDYLVFSRYYYIKKKDISFFVLIIWEVFCMLFDASGIESLLSILRGGV